MTYEQFSCIMNQGVGILALLVLAGMLIFGIVKGSIHARSYVRGLYNSYSPMKSAMSDAGDVFGIMFRVVAIVVVIASVAFGLGYLVYLLGYGSCSVDF